MCICGAWRAPGAGREAAGRQVSWGHVRMWGFGLEAPGPKPTPPCPPGSRWSSTSTRTPSRRGLSCSSSKTKDPVSGVCGGGRAEGLCWSGRGNGRVPCLSSLPPSRVGDARTLEGCTPPAGRASHGSAPPAHSAPWQHRVALPFALWAPSTCLPSRSLATWDAGWGAEVLPVDSGPLICSLLPQPPGPPPGPAAQGHSAPRP